jgi:hypothetical protein
MTEPNPNDTTLPISARYAAMASKSASEAEAAARRGVVAVNGEEGRAAKKARREASDWCDTATLDAMRAHGALAAESGIFEAVHAGADEAAKRAAKARDDAAETYRSYKSDGGD